MIRQKVVTEGNHKRTNVDCLIYNTKRGITLVEFSVVSNPFTNERDWAGNVRRTFHKDVTSAKKTMNRRYPGGFWWTKAQGGC